MSKPPAKNVVTMDMDTIRILEEIDRFLQGNSSDNANSQENFNQSGLNIHDTATSEVNSSIVEPNEVNFVGYNSAVLVEESTEYDHNPNKTNRNTFYSTPPPDEQYHYVGQDNYVKQEQDIQNIYGFTSSNITESENQIGNSPNYYEESQNLCFQEPMIKQEPLNIDDINEQNEDPYFQEPMIQEEPLNIDDINEQNQDLCFQEPMIKQEPLNKDDINEQNQDLYFQEPMIKQEPLNKDDINEQNEDPYFQEPMIKQEPLDIDDINEQNQDPYFQEPMIQEEPLNIDDINEQNQDPYFQEPMIQEEPLNIDDINEQNEDPYFHEPMIKQEPLDIDDINEQNQDPYFQEPMIQQEPLNIDDINEQNEDLCFQEPMIKQEPLNIDDINEQNQNQFTHQTVIQQELFFTQINDENQNLFFQQTIQVSHFSTEVNEQNQNLYNQQATINQEPVPYPIEIIEQNQNLYNQQTTIKQEPVPYPIAIIEQNQNLCNQQIAVKQEPRFSNRINEQNQNLCIPPIPENQKPFSVFTNEQNQGDVLNENVNEQFTNDSKELDNFTFDLSKIHTVKNIIQEEDADEEVTNNCTIMDLINTNNPIDSFSFALDKIGNIEDNLSNNQNTLQNPLEKFSFSVLENKEPNTRENVLNSQNIKWNSLKNLSFSGLGSKEPNTQNYEQIANQRGLDTTLNRNNSGHQKEIQRPYQCNPQKNCPSSFSSNDNKYSPISTFTQPRNSELQFKNTFLEDPKQEPTKIKGKVQLKNVQHNVPFGQNSNELKKSDIENPFFTFKTPFPPSVSTSQSPKEDIIGPHCSLSSNDLNNQGFIMPSRKNKHHYNLRQRENQNHGNKQNSDLKHGDSSSKNPSNQRKRLSTEIKKNNKKRQKRTNIDVLHRVIKDNLRPESVIKNTITFSSRKLVTTKVREELEDVMETYGKVEFSWWTPTDNFSTRYVSKDVAQYVYLLYTKK